MLGASGVQIPENNLDNLKSTREEEDGTSEALDPQDWLGWSSTIFFMLLMVDHKILLFFVLPKGYDLLVLVELFTPVEVNIGASGSKSRLNIPGAIEMTLVTDIAQKDKNEAKRTKSSTGMERVREVKVKAEGVFEFNGPTRSGLKMGERPEDLEGSPLTINRRSDHTVQII
ncbi:hypothetical protein Tco_0002963 [Tanacetum coccineum]